jgi:hypothetical protein
LTPARTIYDDDIAAIIGGLLASDATATLTRDGQWQCDFLGPP